MTEPIELRQAIQQLSSSRGSHSLLGAEKRKFNEDLNNSEHEVARNNKKLASIKAVLATKSCVKDELH